MIILTSVNRTFDSNVEPGDIFKLTVSDCMGHQVIISETITVYTIINYVAAYRFALEDGTCPGFHLCGIFGNKDHLPKEIFKAKHIDDLSPKKRRKFMETVGAIDFRNDQKVFRQDD